MYPVWWFTKCGLYYVCFSNTYTKNVGYTENLSLSPRLTYKLNSISFLFMKLVLLAVFLYDIVYYHLPNINYEVGKGVLVHEDAICHCILTVYTLTIFWISFCIPYCFSLNSGLHLYPCTYTLPNLVLFVLCAFFWWTFTHLKVHFFHIIR